MPDTLQEWLEAAAREKTPLERMASWFATNEHAEDAVTYSMSKVQVKALLAEMGALRERQAALGVAWHDILEKGLECWEAQNG